MRLLQKTLLAVSLTAALALSPTAAHAGNAPGDRGVYTVTGIQYWNQANVIVHSTQAWGETRSGPDTHCVSAGSIAAKAKLFESSASGTGAALRSEGPWYYTEVTLCPGEWRGYTAYYNFGGGMRYFYSHGETMAWNTWSSSYNHYSTIPGKVQNP